MAGFFLQGCRNSECDKKGCNFVSVKTKQNHQSLNHIKIMGTTTNTQKEVKEVYNLIILDRSGSMSSIQGQAIAGVNETIGTIRAAGKEHNLPQKVTITSFCGCSINDFCKNTDVTDVPIMSAEDYQPCCSTPLYDAMGQSLTALRETIKNRTDVAVSVTIITDGYENSSKKWSAPQIKALVELLKADGWLFAYIGANQDLYEIKQNLAIDNTMDFCCSEAGTVAMFQKERKSRTAWMKKVKECDPNANSNYFSF